MKGEFEVISCIFSRRPLCPSCHASGKLAKAHAQLDSAVDRLYGGKFSSDAERVAHLFKMYEQLVR